MRPSIGGVCDVCEVCSVCGVCIPVGSCNKIWNYTYLVVKIINLDDRRWLCVEVQG